MVTNIPPNMVQDQFGIIGLLTFIRAAETDPNLVTLAQGTNLETQGLKVSAEDRLCPLFAGPWATIQCRFQDLEFKVPREYLTNIELR